MNRTVWATIVAVLVAASGSLLAPSAATAAKQEIAVADLEWHDGLNHFVLTPASSFTGVSNETGNATRVEPEARAGTSVPAGSVFGTSRDGRPTAITPDGRIVFLDDPSQKVETSTKSELPAVQDLVGGAEGKERSDAFAEIVRSWPGIVEVAPMNGGMVAVATSLSRADLEKEQAVARVDDDYLLQMTSVADGRPNDPHFGRQWMHENTGDPEQAGGYAGVEDADTDAPLAWARSTGQGAVIADIDSGVDIDHPDLVANIWRNSDEVCGNGVDDDRNGYVDDCVGWDAADNDSNPRPTGSGSFGAHGTHVAGIIAAKADNGIGVAGIAPDAKVMAIKIGSGNGIAVSSILTATMYAVDNGAKVINASWGTPPGTPRSAARLIEQAVKYASDRKVLYVVAAGNDGVNIDVAQTWPASFTHYYGNVLVIGASTNRDKIASFSNDGRTISMFAPGWFIESTLPGASYGMMSGTSMAAPVVSGAAAIFLSRQPEISMDGLRNALPAYSDLVDIHDGASGVGSRVNVASLVGVGVSAFGVEYRNFNTFVPDVGTDVELGLHFNDPGVVGTDAKLVLTIVTPEGGHVYAPSGLEIDVMIDGRQSRVTTDDTGTVVLIDGFTYEQITTASNELLIGLSMALPAGNYALQLQLIDTIFPSELDSVVFFTVGSSSDAGDDPNEAGDGAGSSSGSDGSSGSPGGSSGGSSGSSGRGDGSSGDSGASSGSDTGSSGGGSSGGSSGSSGRGDGSSGGSGASSRSGAGSSGGSSGGDSTSGSGRTSGSSGGTSNGAGSEGSSGDGTGSNSGTTGTTLVASPPSSGAGSGGRQSSDGVGGGTSSGGGATEPLDPVRSGDWVFADVSPRSGSTVGGTTVMISGVFPDHQDARITFGGATASILWASENVIYVRAPSHAEGVVDVIVSATGVALTMSNAYSYVDSNGGSSSGSGGGSTGGAADGGSGSGSSGSDESRGSGDGSTGGSNGPGSTIVDQPEATTPPSVVRRGSLTLRLVSTSHLTAMASDAFPDRVCVLARCGGQLI